MAETKRLKILTFKVDYWNPEDGTLIKTEEVRPVPFLGTDGRPGQLEAIEIQERILEYVIFKTAAIGAMVADPEGLGLLEKAGAMLWVLGKPESQRGIGLNNLLNAGDYTQIGQIFVSKSYGDTEIVNPFEHPSHFAEIHKMNYWGKFYQIQKKKALEDREEATAKIEETIALSVAGHPPSTVVPEPAVSPTPINMPRPLAVALTST